MTGTRVWWYFVAFFGFIAAVNAVMVTIALRTHSGVVTDHPYEKGLAYNDVIKAQEAQAALGWKSRIEYSADALILTLTDKDKQPIAWEKATATITRPTKKDMDFTLALTGTRTPITFPESGLWHVRIDVVHAGAHYQHSERIVVP